MLLSFFVPGIPVTQGSKSARVLGDGRVVIYEKVSGLRSWREAVTTMAKQAMLSLMTQESVRGRCLPIAGPVSVSLAFRLPKPKSNRDAWPIGARTGDVDKLARACLDAMADAGVYANDSQVVSLTVSKEWSPSADRCGVSVVVGRGGTA